MFQIILSKYLLCPMALKLIIKDLRKLSFGYAVHSIQYTLSLYYLIKILLGPCLAISLHMLHFSSKIDRNNSNSSVKKYLSVIVAFSYFDMTC